ncbi:MAG: dihydroneopterin aldolase, partial [Actinobacteria bacterium]|nr:dihydroneopterin aldolase [Actinomycetota bacterium]
MNDTIHLSGIEVFAHHGVFDHERSDGQLFVVD